MAAIKKHVARGDLSDGLIFDAARVRLIEIGEAIKVISPELLANEPNQPWSDIARMRDGRVLGRGGRDGHQVIRWWQVRR